MEGSMAIITRGFYRNSDVSIGLGGASIDYIKIVATVWQISICSYKCSFLIIFLFLIEEAGWLLFNYESLVVNII